MSIEWKDKIDDWQAKYKDEYPDVVFQLFEDEVYIYHKDYPEFSVYEKHYSERVNGEDKLNSLVETIVTHHAGKPEMFFEATMAGAEKGLKREVFNDKVIYSEESYEYSYAMNLPNKEGEGQDFLTVRGNNFAMHRQKLGADYDELVKDLSNFKYYPMYNVENGKLEGFGLREPKSIQGNFGVVFTVLGKPEDIAITNVEPINSTFYKGEAPKPELLREIKGLISDLKKNSPQINFNKTDKYTNNFLDLPENLRFRLAKSSGYWQNQLENFFNYPPQNNIEMSR